MNISSVNNYSRVAQGNAYSPLGFPGPDWTKIPHKGMRALPQDELREKARELGHAFANATSEKERQRIADIFFGEVQMQYASHVAPDRKAIYADAMDTIAKYAGNTQKAGNGIDTTKNIFDFITEADHRRKGMKTDTRYMMANGGAVTANEVTGGGVNFEVTDTAGKPAMLISMGCIGYNGVNYYITDAEQAANKEMENIWHSAIDYAKSNKATSHQQDGIDIRA